MIHNAGAHQTRYVSTYKHQWGTRPKDGLFDGIDVPKQHQKGRVKLRIAYNENEKSVQFIPYVYTEIRWLKLIDGQSMNYAFKHSDRQKIDRLFALRETADDVLIHCNNRITDTSYANICFWDGTTWFTPKNPLLQGTARALALERNQIKAMTIVYKDLDSFQRFKLINALRPFENEPSWPVKNIIG